MCGLGLYLAAAAKHENKRVEPATVVTTSGGAVRAWLQHTTHKLLKQQHHLPAQRPEIHQRGQTNHHQQHWEDLVLAGHGALTHIILLSMHQPNTAATLSNVSCVCFARPPVATTLQGTQPRSTHALL